MCAKGRTARCTSSPTPRTGSSGRSFLAEGTLPFFSAPISATRLLQRKKGSVPYSSLQLGETAGEEAALGLLPSERQRLLVGRACFVRTIEPPAELRARGVRKVI